MYYYEVLVANPAYRSKEGLTYNSSQKLKRGIIVKVPLKNAYSLGVIVRPVVKSAFKTKAIKEILTKVGLPPYFFPLLEWLVDYYPSSVASALGLFIPQYIEGPIITKATSHEASTQTQSLPSLTKEQQVAVRDIWGTEESVILHGNTGSGKTRVYAELSQEILNKGKSVLILTPEIGLTPQLTQYFQEMTTVPVYIMHSNLTPKAKRIIWHTVLTASSPIVVIGPRSALFLPFANLGLIIQDEFHDAAYKQEQSPYYMTSRVAAKLASLIKARLILGSATPPIADYYVFNERKLPIIRMVKLATKDSVADLKLKIVSLTNRENFSISPWLSTTLVEAITTALRKKEQVLLFLNRRGSARLILCKQCGWESLCPKCDIPCVYHGDLHQIVCHTCGFRASAPLKCPVCQSTNIIYKGIGTKTLMTEVARLFPEAAIQRFDADNKKTERFEQHYVQIKKGSVDILIGTQLLTKGLDLPSLSVVGVVAADASLSFPDFSATERTYQLLSQVIGRVGRGHRPGTVIIQTYQPSQQVFTDVATKDYANFYKNELAERKLYKFPPYVYLLHLTCTRQTQNGAKKASGQLVTQLQTMSLPIEILGPVPRQVEHLGGKFHWQIIVKTKQRSNLLQIIQNLPSGWSYDIDPINVI